MTQLFANLATRETFPVPLDGVIRGGNEAVVIDCKFAGRGSAYWNAVMKLKPLANEDAATERAVSLFAKHGVAGWQHYVTGGMPAAYDSDLGAELFLEMLRDERLPIRAKYTSMLDRMIASAMNPDNFIDERPSVEAGELGKK